MLMKVVPATSGRNTIVVKEKMPMAGRLSLVPSTMSLHVGYFSQIQDIVAQELRVCDGVQDLLVFAVDVHLTTYIYVPVYLARCACLYLQTTGDLSYTWTYGTHLPTESQR